MTFKQMQTHPTITFTKDSLPNNTDKYLYIYTHTHTVKESEPEYFLTNMMLNKNYSNVAVHIFSFCYQFSCLVKSDSLQPPRLQHARFPCPSPTPRFCYISQKSLRFLKLSKIINSVEFFSVEHFKYWLHNKRMDKREGGWSELGNQD